MKKAFATNLRKARDAKGYKQREMAVATGVKIKTYQKWEEGLSHPSAEMLVFLANYLEIENLHAWISNPNFDYRDQYKGCAIPDHSPLQSNFAGAR